MKKMLLVVAFVALASADLKKDISNIDFLKKNNISVVKVVKRGSIYVVKGEAPGKDGRMNKADFFVSKDKKTIIFGQAFSNDGQKVSIPIDVSGLKNKEGFIVGKGKNVYYVFTDPQCPYCKQFEEKIKKDNLGKNNKFYFFLYPLSFHKNAKDMSLYVLSHKGDKARWEALLNVTNYKDKKLSDKAKKDAQKSLQTQMDLAKELDVQGTPTVIDSKGRIVNWTQLK